MVLVVVLAGCGTTPEAPTTPVAGPVSVPPTAAAPGPVADTTIAGVPTSPLSATLANAPRNALYACKWVSAFTTLLQAETASDVATQAIQDVINIGQFAGVAGSSDPAYAALATDSNALSQYAGNVAFGRTVLRAPQVTALEGDCRAVAASPPATSAPATTAAPTTLPSTTAPDTSAP
jgi:hypothetical protein